MADVRLSKTLSYILRHGAAKMNLNILQGKGPGDLRHRDEKNVFL